MQVHWGNIQLPDYKFSGKMWNILLHFSFILEILPPGMCGKYAVSVSDPIKFCSDETLSNSHTMWWL